MVLQYAKLCDFCTMDMTSIVQKSHNWLSNISTLSVPDEVERFESQLCDFYKYSLQSGFSNVSVML